MSRFGHAPPSAPVAASPPAPVPTPAAVPEEREPESDAELLYILLGEAIQNAPLGARLELGNALNEERPYSELGRQTKKLLTRAAEAIWDSDDEDEDEDEDEDDEEADDE